MARTSADGISSVHNVTEELVVVEGRCYEYRKVFNLEQAKRGCFLDYVIVKKSTPLPSLPQKSDWKAVQRDEYYSTPIERSVVAFGRLLGADEGKGRKHSNPFLKSTLPLHGRTVEYFPFAQQWPVFCSRIPSRLGSAPHASPVGNLPSASDTPKSQRILAFLAIFRLLDDDSRSLF
jgi:hypothetical protein